MQYIPQEPRHAATPRARRYHYHHDTDSRMAERFIVDDDWYAPEVTVEICDLNESFN